MKKIIAIILAVLLMSAVLVGCTDNNTESSAESFDESSIHDTDSSEEASETSDEASSEVSEEASKPEDIEPEYRTIVSTGCSYTNNCAAGDAYADSYGSELTDGLFAPTEAVGYGDVKLSGYAPASGVFEVVIDLGKEYDKLYGFAGSFLLTNNAGIAPPNSVYIRVSSDGNEWTKVGSLKSVPFNESTMGVYTLDTKQYVSGRYVKFSISKGGAWVFLDELMVYADIPSDNRGADVVENNVSMLYAADNTDYVAGIAAFSTGVAPDKTLTRTNVASGKNYTLSSQVLEKYPDNKKLTDDVSASYYESNTWIGFDGSADVEIVINLNSTVKDISAITLNAFSNHSIKTYLPSCVIFSLSNDKENFTEIGRVYSPVEYGTGAYCFALELDTCLKAHYVKITAKAVGEDTTLLLDEAAVYAYRQISDNLSPLYPAPVFEDKGEINYYTESESDYNLEQNLLLGLSQSIVPGTVLNQSAASNNTPYATKWLTDGDIPTSLNIHSGNYFKSNGGVKRSIIYDLGASCALTEFSAAFLDMTDWAVTVPGQVGIELSQDAETWYVAGYITYQSSSVAKVIDNKLVLDTPVQARYVRFAYQIGTWCGCAELRAIGKKNATGAVKLADAGFNVVRTTLDGDYQAPEADLLKGAGDIALMYHSQSYNYKEETFIPYLAYIDGDGNISDTMFDGFLFLLSGQFPSGVAQHLNSVKTDWEWELAQLYKNGQNITALESAAGKVKQALGLPDDYKYKYYVSIYYPRVEATKFGDVDGDGVSEDCSKFEDREKVIKWYIDLALQYDSNAGFENIELGGFYWFHEAIESSDESNKLINMVAASTEERGYQLFWIPYYCSNGVAEWADYGFATACMQPNYVFNLTTPLSNVKNAADIIKRLGMCLEMEISGDAIVKEEFYVRYIEYLKGGVYYGYMNDCIHMYYQDMQVYYNACYSKNAMARSVYDYTYQFIKGTLDIYPDVMPELKLETSVNTAVEAALSTTNMPLPNYKISCSPSHGTVTIEPNGAITYYPDKDYVGADSFEYVYSEGLDYSETCKVTVTIK